MEVVGTVRPTERGVNTPEDLLSRSMANHTTQLKAIRAKLRSCTPGQRDYWQAAERRCINSFKVMERAAARIDVAMPDLETRVRTAELRDAEQRTFGR